MQRSDRISRQGTFQTDPADFVSGDSIRRGNIQFPVINEDSDKSKPQSHAETTPHSHSKATPQSHSETTSHSHSKATPHSHAEATPRLRLRTTPQSHSEVTSHSQSKTTPHSRTEATSQSHSKTTSHSQSEATPHSHAETTPHSEATPQSHSEATPHSHPETTPAASVTGKELHSRVNPDDSTRSEPSLTPEASDDEVEGGAVSKGAFVNGDVSGFHSDSDDVKKRPLANGDVPQRDGIFQTKEDRARTISRSGSENGNDSPSVEKKPCPPSGEGSTETDKPADSSTVAETFRQPVLASRAPESTQGPAQSHSHSQTGAMADTSSRRKSLARANARNATAQPSDFPGRYSPVRTPDLEVEGPARQDSLSPHTYRVRGAWAGAGAETYENVRAERDSLLKAEAAYKKRIRLLEEDGKQFLAKIEDISQENSLLRDRLEMLDSQGGAVAKPAGEAKEEGGVSRREFEKLKKENASLKDTIQQLERECSQLNRSNKQLHSEKLGDQEKIRDREYLLDANTELQQKNKEQDKKIKELESKKETLTQTLTAMESAQMSQAEDLRTAQTKLEAEVKNQQKAIEEAEEKVRALKAENRTLTETLAKKRQESEELLRALKSDESAAEELKKAQAELATLTAALASAEKERETTKAKVEETAGEKERLARELSEVKVALKGAKVGAGEKEKVAINLRTQLEKLKTEKEESQKKIDQLAADNSELRQLKTEISNLKVKVRTLSGELATSKDSNRKLEKDNDDKQREIERLQRELNRERDEQVRMRREMEGRTSDDAEVQRLRLALEAERSRHKDIDEDMERKKEDIARLEQETFEMNIKIEALNKKMKEAEEERRHELERSLKVSDMELANKELSEENARLRQKVVERNFENTQHRSDKKHLVTRLELLEQRQEDSEIQVKQMRGWMSGLNKHKAAPSAEIVVATTTAVHSQGRSPRGKSPAGMGVSRHSRKTGGGASRTSKAASYDAVRMGDVRQLDLALEDVRSTPSLPPIEEVRINKPIAMTNGYYQMYKNKRKLVRERR